MTFGTVCAVVSLLIASVTCVDQYRFTFTLKEYDNYFGNIGTLINGNSCDPVRCNLGFNICLHEFTTQVQADNFDFCPDGYKDTGQVTNNTAYIIFLDQVYGAVANPLTTTRTSSWKGMVVKVKAYNVNSYGYHDDVDFTNVIFNHDLPVIIDGQQMVHGIKTNPSSLKYYGEIQCINGYESNQCQCHPQNDDINGHFSCNTNGSITCLTNYYDVTTNCLGSVNTQPTPSTTTLLTTEAPTTESPTTESPTTEAPTTEAPTTEAPATEAPTTEAPTTEAPTSPIEMPFHCESPEWYLYNGYCYWSSRISGESASDWFQSSLRCRNMGAQLIDINSYSIEANLLFLNQCNKLWLGLVKTNPDSQNGLIAWEWFNNQANNYRNYDGFGSANYSAFQDFRNHRDNGDCMTTSSNNTKSIWNSVACSEYEDFMCLKQAEGSEDIIQNTCPENGHEISGTCYWTSTKEVDYFAAINHCDEHDASLVSIHSAIDNVHIVRQLCGDDAKCGVDCGKAWIGLDVVDPSTMGSDDAWGWFDRSSLDYENWKNGDVPDALNDAGCAVIGTNGEWEPEMCFGLHVAVCKSN